MPYFACHTWSNLYIYILDIEEISPSHLQTIMFQYTYCEYITFLDNDSILYFTLAYINMVSRDIISPISCPIINVKVCQTIIEYYMEIFL